MTPLDILYTPLDISEPPTVDCTQLVDWICKYQDLQKIENRQDGRDKLKEKYPWNIIYAKNNHAWYKDFDKTFPELAEYCYQAFGLDDDQVHSIVILHTKDEFVGQGFWHTDGDEWGLRFYLDTQETGEFLHLRPTKLPYDVRSEKFILTDTVAKLQDVVYSARLLKPTQGFFINNVRALHAAYTTTPGAMRIAFHVIPPLPIVQMYDHIKQLIVQSAEKYSDHAILWQAPKSLG